MFTAADFDGTFGEAWHAMLGEELQVPAPLASTDVRHVGDPVALVVAESRYLAEDACELIDVEFDASDPCVDFTTAAGDTERIVHDLWGLPSNAMVDVPFTPLSPDLDAVFASSAHVVEAVIDQNRYLCVPMETRGVVASWAVGRDEIDITVSCQSVHETRNFFSRYLGIPEGSIRVHARDVGGGFGQKMFVFREECAVVLAARRLGATVKWIEDRRENLIAAAHSRNERGKVRLAIDADHAIQAIAIEHVADVGAYPPCPAILDPMLLPGPYKIPRLGFSTTMVWTNTMGKGAYRGPWMFETTAREMAIDHAARVIGVDPIALRRVNLLAAADLPFTSPSGNVFQDITPLETLEQALAMLDYDAFRRRAGRGARRGAAPRPRVLCVRRADVDGRADPRHRGCDRAGREQRARRRLLRDDVTRPEHRDDDGADRRRHPRRPLRRRHRGPGRDRVDAVRARDRRFADRGRRGWRGPAGERGRA